MMISRMLAAAFALFAALACVQPPAGSAPGDSSQPANPPANTRESDWAAIVALENQAKTIAKTTGCTSDSQCRTAPVGNRACGGPRYYLAYCAATTDSVALFRKLDEVKAAEDAFNRKYQLASTCEFRMPPAVGITGGACAAQ